MPKSLALVTILALAVPVAVSARTHKITLEVHSSPEGAQVSQGGGAFLPVGVTPLTLTYEIKGACQTPPVISLRWASGATASTVPQLCTKAGTRQTLTVARPIGIAGLDVDLRIAQPPAQLAAPFTGQWNGIGPSATPAPRAPSYEEAQLAYQRAMLQQLQRQTQEAEYANFLAALHAHQAPPVRTSAVCIVRQVIGAPAGTTYVWCP